MELPELRRLIDAVDDQILALLAERARLARAVAAAKKRAAAPHFHDPERERQVLDRLVGKGAGDFPRDAVRTVFREVMSACLALQAPPRVAYLGPEGTFSHMAARKLFGLAAHYHEAPTIEAVFDAVERGDALYGVVPIENSTAGAVTSTLDALIESDLRVRQEVVLDVAQCLLSRAPTLARIERVYSHPQALSQCRQWLARNLASAQLVQTASTAGAAQEALSNPATAAIASQLAGELYGLPVLAERIQDRQENATRFLLLSREDAPPSGNDRTTIVFSMHDGPGALRRALEVFDAAGISLSRIESRPSRQRAWDYVFVADMAGHRLDDTVSAALTALATRCPMVKVIGSYPRAEPKSPSNPRAGAAD